MLHVQVITVISKYIELVSLCKGEIAQTDRMWLKGEDKIGSVCHK